MINIAIIAGNVGKKDTKQLTNGGQMTVISLATTKKYTDASGVKHERTTWHNVNCFDKLAEIAAKFVHVGDSIHVRGEINNSKVEQGERAGQYIYSITAQDIKFLSGGKRKTTDPQGNNAPAPKPTYKPQVPPQNNYNAYDDLNDDIPF